MNTPEEPKFDPRFPPGLGSWRKPVDASDQGLAITEQQPFGGGLNKPEPQPPRDIGACEQHNPAGDTDVSESETAKETARKLCETEPVENTLSHTSRSPVKPDFPAPPQFANVLY